MKMEKCRQIQAAFWNAGGLTAKSCTQTYTDEHTVNGITYGEQKPGILLVEIEYAVSKLKNNKTP